MRIENGKKLEHIFDKYIKKQKITYDEYALMLSENHVMWNIKLFKKLVGSFFVTKYDKNYKATSERSEYYSSTTELLEKARIEGKTIKEIWDKTHFGVLPKN